MERGIRRLRCWQLCESKKGAVDGDVGRQGEKRRPDAPQKLQATTAILKDMTDVPLRRGILESLAMVSQEAGDDVDGLTADQK